MTSLCMGKKQRSLGNVNQFENIDGIFASYLKLFEHSQVVLIISLFIKYGHTSCQTCLKMAKSEQNKRRTNNNIDNIDI